MRSILPSNWFNISSEPCSLFVCLCVQDRDARLRSLTLFFFWYETKKNHLNISFVNLWYSPPGTWGLRIVFYLVIVKGEGPELLKKIVLVWYVSCNNSMSICVCGLERKRESSNYWLLFFQLLHELSLFLLFYLHRHSFTARISGRSSFIVRHELGLGGVDTCCEGI